MASNKKGFTNVAILKRTVLSGLSHSMYGLVAQEILPGTVLQLARDEGNRYDNYAIKVMHNSEHLGIVQIGWVPKGQNDVLAKLLDSGYQLIGGVVSHDLKNPRLDERMYVAIYIAS